MSLFFFFFLTEFTPPLPCSGPQLSGSLCSRTHESTSRHFHQTLIHFAWSMDLQWVSRELLMPVSFWDCLNWWIYFLAPKWQKTAKFSATCYWTFRDLFERFGEPPSRTFLHVCTLSFWLSFFVFHVVLTDIHTLLVYIVSFLLSVACFCLLVRAYRRKHQYRKQKGRQRPLIKRKRDSLSPRTSLLFGNLVSFLDNIIIILNDAVSLSKDYRTVESMSCSLCFKCFYQNHGVKNQHKWTS